MVCGAPFQSGSRVGLKHGLDLQLWSRSVQIRSDSGVAGCGHGHDKHKRARHTCLGRWCNGGFGGFGGFGDNVSVGFGGECQIGGSRITELMEVIRWLEVSTGGSSEARKFWQN